MCHCVQDGLLGQKDGDVVRDAMFAVVCLYPVALGLLQLLAWSHFTIRRAFAPMPTHDYCITVLPADQPQQNLLKHDEERTD